MPVDDKVSSDTWNRFIYARDHGHIQFLRKAQRCDDFFVGDQWEIGDMEALNEQRRPAITINKIISTVGTILGDQIDNRTEVLFRPTAGSPSDTADALSKVFMQISQSNQLPWVRSDVFADGIVRGRGFYEVRMDFDDSMQGKVVINPINSKNVVIDPDAETYDPDNWNDVFVTKWLSPMDVEILYSKEDADYLKTCNLSASLYGFDAMELTRDRFAGRDAIIGAYGSQYDPDVIRNIRILDRQHRKVDKQLHFVDIQTGDMRPIPSDWDRNRIAALLEKAQGKVSTTKKLVKRIRWTVTAGNVVLHDDWSPYQHYTVIPYFPHFRYGRTVGIVENLLGPQEILNKVSSQELHIVNTTANSGWVVEENSLVNMTIEELESKGATTGLIIEHRKGTEPPQKIQPNQTPTGLDRISFKTEEHIKTISGVSDSMQGFDRADVAAKAIAYKQQQGSVSLAKIKDNLERTDWLLARNVLGLIQTYYTEPRLLTITKDDFTNAPDQVAINQPQINPDTGEQEILNDLTLGEYDIVITSSPYRSSLEDSQFEQARALREIGVKIPDSVLIENSRLMRRNEIVKQIEQMNQSPMAMQQQQLQLQQLQGEVAKLQADAANMNADAQLKQVRAQKEQKETQLLGTERGDGDSAADAQATAMQHEHAHNEILLQADESMAKTHLAKQKLDADIENRKAELSLRQGELALRREELALKREQGERDFHLQKRQVEQQGAAQLAQSLRGDSAGEASNPAK